MCLAHRDVGRRGRRLAGGAFDPGSRELLERVLPGAFGQAVADAEAPFGVEVPSLQGWPRGPDDVRRVGQPGLAARGADGSRPGFRETQEAVLSWLPDGEALVVPRATHLLQIANPRAVAEGLADFLARHPS
jgi:pimeloyl-ACP methyl ester carboxylesterase